jgi:hypothetical protein
MFSFLIWQRGPTNGDGNIWQWTGPTNGGGRNGRDQGMPGHRIVVRFHDGVSASMPRFVHLQRTLVVARATPLDCLRGPLSLALD